MPLTATTRDLGPGLTASARAWRMLAVLAVAEFLGMTLWFSATAVTPRIVEAYALGETAASWLTMAVQAGFVVGTLATALLNLADVVPPRRLVLLGCVAGAIANGSILVVTAPAAVIATRFVTGAALACVYPPAMKIAAGWFRDQRGFALGLLVGALTLGKAFPHLLTSIFGTDWQTPMRLASALALAGGLLVTMVVRDGPFVAPTAPFDPHAVRHTFAVRGVRLATLGYLGHMWELYAMWTWVAVFAAASLAASGVADPSRAGELAAFVAIGSGTAGCGLAGWLADRLGKARVAIVAMAVSAACALAAGAVFGRSPALLYALVMVWGFAVVADSAQFSALVTEHAPRDHVGTALTVQTSVGFLLTMVTIEGLPRVAALTGWQWASLLLVPGPVLGILAMRGLRTAPPGSTA